MAHSHTMKISQLESFTTPALRKLVLALGGLVLLSAQASAQDATPSTAASAPTQLDTVTVQMQKDPAVLPYAMLNRVLTQLQTVGEGLVRLDFKLLPKDDKKPLVNPKLALSSEDRYIPIPVAADGAFVLPLLPQAQAKEAEVASNQPKGTMRIQGLLEINAKPEEVDMKLVRRLMRVGHSLRTEMLPFYLRWLMPQIEGLKICSPQAGWQLEWPEGGQTLALPLEALPPSKNPVVKKDGKNEPDPRPFCTVLSGQERWPDAAKLVAPTNSKLSVQLSR